MKRRKIISIIIIILVLLGGVFYSFNRNTSGLKKYKNNELGLEFMYPAIYRKEKTNNDSYYLYLTEDNVKYHPGNMSIQDNSFSILKKKGDEYYKDTEILTIGDYKYYYKYSDFSFEGYNINFYYYPIDKDKTYYFEAGSSQSYFEGKNHPVDQTAREILKTIKFTK